MIRSLFISLVFVITTALPLRAGVDITEVETPGGFSAWLVEEPAIPFVALELSFRGGIALDPVGKEGVVNLMTALLEEGAGERDAQAFALAREELAAGISFDAYDDGISISVRYLSETQAEVMALLKTVFTDPRFDPDAVERVRGQVLANIRSEAQDPESIAGQAMAQLVYGDHPYARRENGTVETVTALTRDDLLAAHHATLAKDRVIISAVGDITEGELAKLIDDLLADLPETGAPMPQPAQLSFDGQVHVVDFPTPQAVVRFIQPGLARDDPDFFAAYVMNQVLGAGGFGSRLMAEVREKRGLTYGIAAYLARKDYANLYAGGFATANATVSEAIELVRTEWSRMAEEGVTKDELSRAKTYLTGAYPLRFDGSGQIASIMIGMQADGLSPDYITTRNSKVEAITQEDVARIAARLLDPTQLSFIVVGQPDPTPVGN